MKKVTKQETNHIREYTMEKENYKIPCKLRFVNHGYSLAMSIPKIFPEYNDLCKGKKVYFLEKNNQIFFSLNKPNEYKFEVRKMRDCGKFYKSVFVVVPTQFRKKFKLDDSEKLSLIYNDDGTYLCQFEKNNKTIPDTNIVSDIILEKLIEGLKWYYNNQNKDTWSTVNKNIVDDRGAK